MKMKKIAAFFDKRSFKEFLEKDEYSRSYREFGEIISQKNGQFFVVTKENYDGNNIFSRGLIFQNGDFSEFSEKIVPDIIYKKGKYDFEKNINVVNCPEIEKLENKNHSFSLFPKLFSKTIIIKNKDEIDQSFSQIPSDKIVVKPLDSYGGDGVFIGTKKAAAKKIPCFRFLAQEFMDGSNGIPGIVDGIHDFRMISISGKIIVAFVRTPPPGSLLANLTLGGGIKEIPISKIPAGAKSIFEKIDQNLKKYEKRIYSVDLLFTEKKEWKLIEINTFPGLQIRDRGAGFLKFQEKLADLFLS